MFTRISSIALLLLLSSCGDREKSNGPAPLVQQGRGSAQQTAAPVEEPPKTVCAVEGEKEFTPVCDREIVDGFLTIRHPGGGFRRFQIMTDGSGVIAADGSEPSSMKIVGASLIEVNVSGDRYRLPAAVQR
jgi:hypothetical protein